MPTATLTRCPTCNTDRPSDTVIGAVCHVCMPSRCLACRHTIGAHVGRCWHCDCSRAIYKED